MKGSQVFLIQLNYAHLCKTGILQNLLILFKKHFLKIYIYSTGVKTKINKYVFLDIFFLLKICKQTSAEWIRKPSNKKYYG